MMELTEDFIKLLQIAIIVVGVLAIYFSYINYNVIIETRKGERDATVLGNYLLSSECLTYSDTKSLFSEDKLDIIQTDSSCLKKQYPFGIITVELQDLSKKWQIYLGPYDLGGESILNIVVKMTSGEIKPATMTVKI